MNVMNEFLYGTGRSTAHATCVRKVYRYLKKKCGEADYERKTVADRITDTWGYNQKSKTWYLCEIKVNWSDLQKAPYQIHDTIFRFKKTHRGDNVVPVIAFPVRLQKELVGYDNWDSLCDLCRNMGVAIWVVEQSGVREEITSPKTKTVKTNNTVTKAVKIKQPMKPKAKTSKPRATSAKTAKLKTSSVKSSEVKRTKAPPTKSKTSKVRVTKARVARTKRV